MTDVTAQNGQEDYRHHVEQTFSRYASVMNERDELRKAIAKCQSVIAQADVQIAAYKDELEAMRRERRSYQLERDQAVAERAKYESLFIGLHAQLHAFKLPAEPLVKEELMEGEKLPNLWVKKETKSEAPL